MTFNKLPYSHAPCNVQVELTVYPMFDGGRGALKLPFTLTRGQEVMDALNLFLRQHHIHATLTTSLLSLINDAIRSTLKSRVNEAFLKRISDKTEEDIKADALNLIKSF
ncbi:hypothetical protein DSO57_1015740 [Entomophthora muscae]|uniref:Uncharacterized protein n=1 Tax=Entomophthora muscae TaxID=34485 RepID=A0ACC2TS96_9FUNG|nr:hypothetical protein DSO57_1015740 [Entomophthora muscae]